MERSKLPLIVVVIAVFLFGSFFAFNSFFQILNPAQRTDSENKMNSDNMAPKLAINSPFQTLNTNIVNNVAGTTNQIDNNNTGENISNDFSTSSVGNSFLQQVSDGWEKIKNYQLGFLNSNDSKNSGSNSSMPEVAISDLNIQASGANTAVDYYKKFLDVAIKDSFTQSELSHMEKETEDKGTRVLLLEELIDKANSGTDI